jgi:hypothetical protein
MLLLAFAALTAAPQPPAAQTHPTSSMCARTTSYLADAESLYRGRPLTPRRLTELPDANLYFGVYRRIDGCEAPIIVKYGVSGR